ncbi:ribonuclease HII [soil metagenome]
MIRTVGIDEVGRGCWAGPLVAGAVLIREPIEGLADSKSLTASRRTVLSQQLYQDAIVSLGWVSNEELDRIGLSEAVRLAMARALQGIEAEYDEVIIDGSYNFLPHIPASRAVVRADGSIPCVSGASIVAKVARDTYMYDQALRYPHYGFDSHVGYGTKKHRAALDTYGITPLHRTSFKPIKKLVTQKDVDLHG